MIETNSPKNDLISPFSLESKEGTFWLKGNLHSHTTNSDGRATPQERLSGYVKQGYDFLCLSDHYKITRSDGLDRPEDFVLIPGAELHPDNPFGGQRHHFLALNIQKDLDSAAMPPQNVIDEVRDQGGSIWLAHPYWSSVNVIRDTLPLQGLAGVEVYNTTTRRHGRAESGVHWDDWMEQEGKLYPALANDDAHLLGSEGLDTYGGWTNVRVKERDADSIIQALEKGCSYASTGAEIYDVQLTRVDEPEDGDRIVEATVRCSEAERVFAICNAQGMEYQEHGRTFDKATFALRKNERWVRFEVIGPSGAKAWSNPFDLTVVGRG